MSTEGLIPGITAVVLTMNGERLLDRCLTSLSFCDYLLCVDSGSTDRTEKICAAHGAEFIRNEWKGFAAQFTFAQSKVKTRWMFIVDQDEICPEPLAQAVDAAVIEAVALSDTPADACTAFSVGRISWYFDRFMKHGGWHPDHILRVFRTREVTFSQDAHIHYHPTGRTEHIGGPGLELVHYPYTGFFHQLTKLNTYAEQGAEALRVRHGRGGVLLGSLHGMARFFRIYFWKLGFLDGRAGFLAACHGSFYAFCKYVRVSGASWGAPYAYPPLKGEQHNKDDNHAGPQV